MSEAERLPPVLQRRMARLALKGWRFSISPVSAPMQVRRLRAGLKRDYWTATGPDDAVPGHVRTMERATLELLLSDLVGFDA